MLCRCYDKRTQGYKNYGGRGIKVCDRWRHSFENFLSDMGPRPSPQHSLDRFPDPDGNYEPANCRWATAKEQGRNKRNNIQIIIGGQPMALIEYLELAGLSYELIRKRLRIGWAIEEALSVPLGKPRFRPMNRDQDIDQEPRFMRDALDIAQADDAEITISQHHDGFRIWFNVEGKNYFRAYRVGRLTVDDKRQPQDSVRQFAQSILHGDAAHRDWLLEAANAFVRGLPTPKQV